MSDKACRCRTRSVNVGLVSQCRTRFANIRQGRLISGNKVFGPPIEPKSLEDNVYIWMIIEWSFRTIMGTNWWSCFFREKSQAENHWGIFCSKIHENLDNSLETGMSCSPIATRRCAALGSMRGSVSFGKWNIFFCPPPIKTCMLTCQLPLFP